MHKRYISKQVKDFNLRRDIREGEYLFNSALSTVEFPANNIPYFPGMYSNILAETQSSMAANGSSSSEENSGDDTNECEREVEDEAKIESEIMRERVKRAKIKATQSMIDKTIPFPEQLMQFLFDNEFKEIVDWISDGLSFMVYDKKNFVNIVLPVYFDETSKFASFTRKLLRWGFKRIDKGPETGAWKHEHFVRNNPMLCKKMRCQKKSEIKKRIKRNTAKHNATSIHENSEKCGTVAEIANSATIANTWINSVINSTDDNVTPSHDNLVRDENENGEIPFTAMSFCDNPPITSYVAGNKIEPSPEFIVSNQNLYAEDCEKIPGDVSEENNNTHAEEFVNSSNEATVSLWVTNIDMSSSPDFLTMNGETHGIVNSSIDVPASSDADDNNVFSPEVLARNQSNLLKLMELRNQEKEILDTLDKIIKEASEKGNRIVIRPDFLSYK